MPSQAVQDAIARVTNTRLKAQTGAMAGKTAAVGGSVKKGGPSILGRIMDVISRPMYAIDEPIARLAEGKGVGDVARGVVSGLAGKSKSDVGSIIERGHGGAFQSINKNKPLKAGLSLVGDVLTDPLTYVSGGLVHAGAEGLAKSARVAAIAEHLANPETVRAIEEAGNLAKAAKGEKVLATGKEVSEKALARAAKSGARTERVAQYEKALQGPGQAAYDAAKTAAPGKVQFKLAGKVVGESEKLYEGTAKLGRIVGDTSVGKSLNEAFRTSSKFPEITNRIRREVQLAGIAKAERDMKDVKTAFKDLLPHELELVTHAAEAGPVPDHLAEVVSKTRPKTVGEMMDMSDLHEGLGAKLDGPNHYSVPGDVGAYAEAYAKEGDQATRHGYFNQLIEKAGKSPEYQAEIKKALEDLPDEVTVFRGEARPAGAHTNVTLDPAVAAKFTLKGEAPVAFKVPKSAVKAIGDSKDMELIVSTSKLKKLEGVASTTEKATKPSSLHGVISEAGNDLGPSVDKMREILDGRLADEVAAGVHRDAKTGRALTFDEARKENYVPHYYKGLENEQAAIKRLKVIGADKPGFTMPQSIKSVAHAKSLGMPVTERADEILMKRIGASHSAIARAKYSAAVAKEYGVDMASEEGKKLFYGKAGKKRLSDLGFRTVDSPYVAKTVLLPDHIAKSYEALEAMHSSDELVQKFLKHFDKIQNQWKFWNTAANPGHHLRNMVGDAWNNFALGGVTNPKRYEEAGRLVFGGKPEEFTTKIGEATLSGTDILRHNIESGAKPGFTLGELQNTDMSFLGGVKGKVANAAEKREEFMRMANFLEQFKQAGKGIKTGPNLEAELSKAASEAGAKVRHINIDYGDMTDFEKKYLKRVMPFYTWTRKNIPLQLEALAMHPGRVAAIPKGQAAIERLLGTSDGYNVGPLDTIPKWLKEMSTVRLQGEGEGKNAIYWAPALPFQDLAKYTEGGKQGILRSITSQLNPAIRMPLEQATGQKLFSGAPVGSNTEYVAGQLSPLNQLYKLLTGKQDVKSAQTLNYLTGAGAYEVTPNQVSAELRRQQVPLKASIRNAKKKAGG